MTGAPNFWIVTSRLFKRHTTLESAVAEKERLQAMYGGAKHFHLIRCKGVTSSPASRREGALVDALQAARAIVAEDIEAILEDATIPGADAPRDTLDDLTRAAVDELDGVLARIDGALALAAEPVLLPEELAQALLADARENVAASEQVAA